VNPLSHLKFVDDTMLMVHPLTKEASSIKANLDSFLLASKTMINQDMSLFFFVNTYLITQHNILCILSFQKGALPLKYLGVPLIENMLRDISWKYLISNLDHILGFWTFLSLNLLGILTFHKSVLKFTPLYLFLVLTTTCKILKSIKSL
jgi:hypothetical protein